MTFYKNARGGYLNITVFPFILIFSENRIFPFSDAYYYRENNKTYERTKKVSIYDHIPAILGNIKKTAKNHLFPDHNHSISSATINRLRQNQPVSTSTINDAMHYLNCTPGDILAFTPSASDQMIRENISAKPRSMSGILNPPMDLPACCVILNRQCFPVSGPKPCFICQEDQEEDKNAKVQKIGRNDPCWCGGHKYKDCHLDFDAKLSEYRRKGSKIPHSCHDQIQSRSQRSQRKDQCGSPGLCGRAYHAGITTEQIDLWVYEQTTHRGGIGSIKYRRFPKSVCTSVNDPGVPRYPTSADVILKDGDIINVDVLLFIMDIFLILPECSVSVKFP